MNVSHGRIPHVISATSKKLITELEVGIQSLAAVPEYNNSHKVRSCIEDFVDALDQAPGVLNELCSRATLIENRCGPSSDYHSARKNALKSYNGRPRNQNSSKQAIDKLRTFSETPRFLEQVIAVRGNIECILDADILRLSPPAKIAFNRWLDVCRKVQQKAGVLYVDGCRELFLVHQSGEKKPSEQAKIAKAVVQGNLGFGNLESIKSAVESMIDWVRESQITSPAQYGNTAHSTDFRSVRWFGKNYSFTVNQSHAVQLLYENWKAGTPDVGNETLLSAVDHEAPPARLATLFRDHPAWGNMIVPGGSKGSHRLADFSEKT